MREQYDDLLLGLRLGLQTFESKLIPRINNAVEMVIRRFDQHLQDFDGFENIETA